jgi:hypothetical protein
MGGQKIGNPHQILHDAVNPALFGIEALRFTNSSAPNYGQGTQAQMETATLASSPANLLFSRLYHTTTNPYPPGVGAYPNYQTYQGVLQNAQQASYLTTVANDGKMYVFKTLSSANTQVQNILIKELPASSAFIAAADPNGGSVRVRVTQSGFAAALHTYQVT